MKMHAQRGVVLVGILITFSVLLFIALAVAAYGVSHYSSVRRTLMDTSALDLAEAGGDNFMYQVNQTTAGACTGRNYTGTSCTDITGQSTYNTCNNVQSPVTVFNNPQQGKGTYTTCVTNGNFSNEKFVYATGRLYVPATAAQPTVTRKIRLVIRGTNPFQYALQTGTGPIYMFGNSGLTGNVFSNGYIIVQDTGVTLKGTFTALQTDPEYTNGGQPCAFGGNGNILNSTIYYPQGGSPSQVCVGTTGSTMAPSPVGSQQMPTVDRSGILGGITQYHTCSSLVAGGTISGGYTSDGTSGGAACDLTLAKNKNYTIQGDSYIKGNFVINGNILTKAASDGTDSNILVDGRITISGNGSAIVPNSGQNSAILVSYSNADASSPTYNVGCTVVNTGPPTCSANDIKTYSNGSNSTDGAINVQGNALSLNALLLAENGSLDFKGSGSIGSMAAKTMVLNGGNISAFVKISQTLTDPNIWDVLYYEQVFH